MTDEKRAADDAERELYVQAMFDLIRDKNTDKFDDIARRVARLSVESNEMSWRMWQARAALSARADGGKDSSDAERYRYLRNCGVIVDFTRSGPWKFTDDVDAAIDKYLERKAAIAGEKK